jgi:hypothetical protein
MQAPRTTSRLAAQQHARIGQPAAYRRAIFERPCIFYVVPSYKRDFRGEPACAHVALSWYSGAAHEML